MSRVTRLRPEKLFSEELRIHAYEALNEKSGREAAMQAVRPHMREALLSPRVYKASRIRPQLRMLILAQIYDRFGADEEGNSIRNPMSTCKIFGLLAAPKALGCCGKVGLYPQNIP